MDFDLIVIGSGFGGAMAAAPAVFAGKRVLMIEAGDWVERGPHNWSYEEFFENAPAFERRNSLSVTAEGKSGPLPTFNCVGGASVYFGGVSMRLREADFQPAPEIDQDSGAEWPYTYADLEPFYSEAETLLHVAGSAGVDPTEPPRSRNYPRPPAPLARISARLSDAARALGLHPFPLPLSINYSTENDRTPCQTCGTCDGYACAVHSKNDVATVLIPRLQRAGMELLTDTRVVAIDHRDGRAFGVAALPASGQVARRFGARAIVVAAGTLETPRLLIGSGLDKINTAGDAIGRYLMRHCNAVVLGVFPTRPAPDQEFHKQIAIHDYYFGHPTVTAPSGRLGSIQQFATPKGWILRKRFHGLGRLAGLGAPWTTGFIVMAEDRPSHDNRLEPQAPSDPMTGWSVTHDYDARDRAARDALVGAAKRILRRAGALPWCPVINIPSFSHAVGTVRLGKNPRTSPLDEFGTFRGVGNLFVTDGSALPRSGGVNPSLTISANALRTGHHIVKRLESSL
ncbi:MAG TPA: GMC family oxidoreductase [Vicinamibacterales bacterium]|nr:GMC family oxidoreductase [Vicinamibacterales bacterium]